MKLLRLATVMLLASLTACTSSVTAAPADGAAACVPGFPTLTLSESAVDFGAHAVGSSTAHPVTLTNAGSIETGTLSIGSGLGAPFTLAGGAFPGAGGSCGATLAAGQSCRVIFSFAPANGPSMFETFVFFDYVDPLRCGGGAAGSGGGPQAPTLSIHMTGSSS